VHEPGEHIAAEVIRSQGVRWERDLIAGLALAVGK
jgi:hypothetical protein